jgi:hypothetical protein
MKISIQSLATVTLTIVGFALLPNVQAVVPPPDGGYPGFNTAEGTKALQNLTSSIANAAVGWYSLFSNTDGSYNTALGTGTLLFNLGNQDTGEGTQNTAIGVRALLSNTSGSQNTAAGASALFSNTDGVLNTATGANALFSNTTGDDNTANSYQALFHNTTGGINTAVGCQTLFSNTEGSSNTAIGVNVLFNNSSGSFNTASGDGALFSNTTGIKNNTALGYAALNSNNTGSFNTAVGDQVLFRNTTGSFNTAIDRWALSFNTIGTDNVAIGDEAGINVTTANNVICIGTVAGADVSQTTWIANVYGATTQSGQTAQVIVSNTGQLGTVASSERFKKDIATMDRASEGILSLRLVTFHYKSDAESTPQFGLIAEEVAKVNPALVLPDKEGKPYTVRYDAVNAMLLNEFLKEHRKVQEQESTMGELKSAMAQQRKDFEAAIAEQRKTAEALIARSNEQEARIQKVSVQIEVRNPEAQMLAGNQ